MSFVSTVAARTRAVAAGLAGAAALVVAAPAQAETVTPLDATWVGALVVDDTNQRVFVSHGPHVSVLDFDGSVVAEIDVANSSGMTLVDGSLYVARCATSMIERYDAATLAHEETISTGHVIGSRCELAAAGGRLWFAEGSTRSVLVGVSMDASHAVTVATGLPTLYNPVLRSSSGAPATLYAVETGISTTRVFALDASETPVAPVAGQSILNSNGWTAVSPDGASIVLRGAADASVRRTLDGSQTLATYPQHRYNDTALAGAFNADGGRLAVLRSSSFVVYDADSGARTYDVPVTSIGSGSLGSFGRGFVGWTEAGDRVFAAGRTGAGQVTFHVFERVQHEMSAFSVSAPASTPVGEAVDATGRLTDTDGSPRSGVVVHRSLRAPDGTQVALGDVITSSTGEFPLVDDAFDHSGDWVVTATYAGDAGHIPAEVTTTLQALQRPGSISLSVSRPDVTYGQTVTVTVQLAGFHTNRAVTIYAISSHGVRTQLATGVVDGAGRFELAMRATRGARYEARYDGDDWYTAASSRLRQVTVWSRLTTRLVGGYRTTGGYRLYRLARSCWATKRKGCPVFAVSASADQALRKAYLNGEMLVRGRWQTAFSIRPRLSAKATYEAPLVYHPNVKGVALRIRASLPSTNDVSGPTSPWTYFRITG